MPMPAGVKNTEIKARDKVALASTSCMRVSVMIRAGQAGASQRARLASSFAP